jgi:hypothetical protein
MEKRRSTLIAIFLLLIVTLAMFADVLLAGGTRVLGHQASDLYLQYYAWRDFGFRELARGNLALWNPHIFSGAPYFGGMQGAQLYPPNLIFLILPLPAAINWSVAIHVFAVGAFMFLWLRQRQLRVAPSFFGATTIMFCGAFFPHIFAGHLPQMCAMAWAPLIFCAIDGLFESVHSRWILLGIFAVAMQVLAGFPQYVFYTALIAGLYTFLRLLYDWNWSRTAALLSIYAGAALLAAVQLLAAVETTRETTRGLRLPFGFASMVAFPPENFLTLVAPDFLGGMTKYWGRWYLWETSLFVGIIALAFAVYAVIYCERKGTLPAVIVILASLLLALGTYTPLFSFLYNWVPGFDRFRAISKFIFPASLLLILLAATGLDRFFREERIPKGFVVSLFAVAFTLAVAAWWARSTTSWSMLMSLSSHSGQSYLFPRLYSSADFISQSQHSAAMSLVIEAGFAAALGIILIFVRRDPRILVAIIVLGLGEMSYFAYETRATSDSASFVNPEEKSFLAEHPGDYRIMNVANSNSAMILGAQDMWGYDATVVRRYAEFITWSQGGDPNNAMSYVKFTQFDALFAMLRQRYVFAERAGKLETAEAPSSPLAHLQLISKYRVLEKRDAIFERLRADDFDPAREVILESEPEPRPATAEIKGTAEIVNATTDSLTIEADIDQPAILLITDAFTTSWRAVALPGSSQSSYQLLPANYILRAVPLGAGHHLLRVEYASSAFALGRWISTAAALAFFAALFWTWRQAPAVDRNQPAIKKSKRNRK